MVFNTAAKTIQWGNDVGVTMELGDLNVREPKKDVGPLPYIRYKTGFR